MSANPFVWKINLTTAFFCGILKENATWGCSSVGRASGLQPEGQRFNSAHLHRLVRERPLLCKAGFFDNCIERVNR